VTGLSEHQTTATLGSSTPPFQSASDLAKRIGQDVSAVETYLRRHRDRFSDCFREVEGGRRNEPRYLYRVSDVLQVLEQHFKG
jgi:hypothetical protein